MWYTILVLAIIGAIMRLMKVSADNGKMKAKISEISFENIHLRSMNDQAQKVIGVLGKVYDTKYKDKISDDIDSIRTPHDITKLYEKITGDYPK